MTGLVCVVEFFNLLLEKKKKGEALFVDG